MTKNTRSKNSQEEPKGTSARPTTQDVNAILGGAAIDLTYELDYPLSDIKTTEDGRAIWLLQQPDDWLYDMAFSVQQAASAQILQDEEIKLAKNAPPSDAWIRQNQAQLDQMKKRIEELRAAPERTEQDELELFNLNLMFANHQDPASYSRAQELADEFGVRRRDVWLMRRLVTDENGDLLFSPDSPAGNERWAKIGRATKDRLRRYIWQVIRLVQIAKNSKADRDSN